MSIEDICLLSCRSPFLDDAKIYVPLGNLYLKSFIEANVSGACVGLKGDNYSLENLDFLKGYDAVGISIMTPQREEANKLLTAIKKQFPKMTVIAGGPHCKHYLEDVKKEAWDYIVPLDGEKALAEIMRGNAPRVVYSVMDKMDIAIAPRPDRKSLEAVNLIKEHHYSLDGKNATTMMTARGCPEQCTFCEDAMTSVKWSSIENIRGELDDIVGLGYKGVYIFDDLFAIAMPKVAPICEELAKRDLAYRCNGQVRYFTKWGSSFAELLAGTGCKEIAFGFESGSQKILDNVKKRTTVIQNYEAVQYAKQNGMKVKAFLMLGLPGEDAESISATEDFIKNSGVDDFQLAIYYPYKGTQIRDAIDRGEASTDLAFMGEGLGAYGQKGGSTEAVVETKSLSAQMLLSERDRLVRTYKPKSHTPKWEVKEDKFFDTHLKEG